MVNSIQTVLGLIKPEELGRTLTHEHFSLDFSHFYTEPPKKLKSFFEKKITLNNVGIIKQYPYGSAFNISFNDVETHKAVFKEMSLYKQFGGGAIVENTTHGLQRNVHLMKEVSEVTGVHVIAGTGYYVSSVQPATVLNLTKEQMYEVMFTEMTVGCPEQPDIKCGVIGEVGSNWPLHDFEKRAIEATALVQATLGCPVTFHPGRHPDAPAEIVRLYLEAGGDVNKAVMSHLDISRRARYNQLPGPVTFHPGRHPDAPAEIVRLYLEAGGDVNKAVMSHLDRTLLKDDELLNFSELGCYCQFDLFGTECLLYQLNPSCDMPSDNQRLDKVVLLVAEGKADRILLAHDIHTKHRLMDFGGHGFSHILNNVLPKLAVKGVSEEIIDQISIANPQTWLASPWEKHQQP